MEKVDHQSSLQGGNPPGFWRELLLPLAIAAAFFASYLVNLGAQEFTNASENVVIQAALEIRQGGPAWIPNLLGKPRITKPPLATWITAAAMDGQTVIELSKGDVPSREAVYRRLAVQARWPVALCSCLTLLAVYGLGRVMASRQVGLAAMAICGSAMLLLRFGRMANTDVQIMLWVAWTNLCLAMVVLRGRWWLGCLGAGVCMGLAILSKGPVCLVQSFLPCLAFGLYRRYVPVEGLPASPVPSRQTRLAAVVAGTIVFLAIALPWPVSVMMSQSGMMFHWFKEITRAGATDNKPDAWWGYVTMLANMLPWTPLVIGGLCFPLFSRFRHKPIMLAWMLLGVPIFIMSFAADKNERYTMPMIPAASLLAGYLAMELLQDRSKRTASDRLVVGIQWAVACGMAVGLIAGAIPGTAGPGVPWYSWPIAIGGAGTALAIVVASLLMSKRVAWIGIPATALVSLIAYHLFMYGYCTVGAGRSGYKELALRTASEYPDAEVLFHDSRPNPRHVPTDLAIYFGRVVHSTAVIPSDAAANRVQIMLLLQGDGTVPPEIPQWTWLFSGPVEGKMYSVYRRLPTGMDSPK